MTAADYAALEARVSELEHQLRNVVAVKLDATNYAVSLVHSDTQAILERLDRHDQRFDAIGQRLDRQSDALTEILRRLPARPSNGPAGGEDDH